MLSGESCFPVTIHGQPAVESDGTQSLEFSTGMMTGGDSDFYIAMMVQQDSPESTHQYCFYYGTGASRQGVYTGVNAAGSEPEMGFHSDAETWNGTATSADTPLLLEIAHDASASQINIWVNAEADPNNPHTLGGDPNVSQSLRYLGRSFNGGNMNGLYGAFLHRLTIPTAAEQADIRTYMDRYGYR